jgi:hypothetical protein
MRRIVSLLAVEYSPTQSGTGSTGTPSRCAPSAAPWTRQHFFATTTKIDLLLRRRTSQLTEARFPANY